MTAKSKTNPVANLNAPSRFKPTAADLIAAKDKTLPDVIGNNLRVLFAGINPGLYTAAVGHHFARPGNRFWPALFAGGFTPRVISPFDEQELLAMGLGITNVVNRASAAADELSNEELIAGAKQLHAKVKRFMPKFLAVLGVGAYRTGFARPKAMVGLQTEMIDKTRIWVLPNPSGLNAHYQAGDIAKVFRELRNAAFDGRPPA